MHPTNRRIALSRIVAVVALGLAGCATLTGDPGEPLVPTRYQTRTGPFAVFTSKPLEPSDPIVRGLGTLRDQLETELGVRVDSEANPIEVYILADRDAFAHFLRYYYPDLPARRAFFLAQGARRVVYTSMGDRLEEDLRHEATHALLHRAYGDLPLWLDEGLAEYFEGPPTRGGINPEHLDRLPRDREDGWRPDLARLESLRGVRQMTPRDYRESWLWAHYLLTGPEPGKEALLAYLGELRAEPDAPTLSTRLDADDPTDTQHILAHLDRAGANPLAFAPASRARVEPTIRMQNPVAEPIRPARRGFFGRLFGL